MSRKIRILPRRSLAPLAIPTKAISGPVLPGALNTRPHWPETSMDRLPSDDSRNLIGKRGAFDVRIEVDSRKFEAACRRFDALIAQSRPASDATILSRFVCAILRVLTGKQK